MEASGQITPAPQQENDGREAMADRPFRNPLLAKLDDTSHYTASSAWEALEYLQRYGQGLETILTRLQFICAAMR
jgi:hypothetical protein